MQLMDYYLEAGGNVLDAAEVYASFVPGGEHQHRFRSGLGFSQVSRFLNFGPHRLLSLQQRSLGWSIFECS
jgi:hypothetical protein